MKIRIYILLLVVSCMQLSKAQNQSIFNLGINTDFNSIPLTDNSMLSNSTVVNIAYNLNEQLNFKIGYEGSVVKENQIMKYTDLSGFLIGFGYYLNNKEKKEFNTEFFASFTNAFNNFSTFENFHSDLGIRFYYKKLFYIGTAVRYSNNNLNILANRENFNWNWQMGIQLPILKIMK